MKGRQRLPEAYVVVEELKWFLTVTRVAPGGLPEIEAKKANLMFSCSDTNNETAGDKISSQAFLQNNQNWK